MNQCWLLTFCFLSLLHQLALELHYFRKRNLKLYIEFTCWSNFFCLHAELFDEDASIMSGFSISSNKIWRTCNWYVYYYFVSNFTKQTCFETFIISHLELIFPSIKILPQTILIYLCYLFLYCFLGNLNSKAWNKSRAHLIRLSRFSCYIKLKGVNIKW